MRDGVRGMETDKGMQLARRRRRIAIDKAGEDQWDFGFSAGFSFDPCEQTHRYSPKYSRILTVFICISLEITGKLASITVSVSLMRDLQSTFKRFRHHSYRYILRNAASFVPVMNPINPGTTEDHTEVLLY